MGYHLSKSRYCSGVQCPKMLWLKKNKPEAFDDSVMNDAVLETGSLVGDLAMGLFGAYVEIPYGDLGEMIQLTDGEMEKETPIVAEASFSVDGLFCSVDILKRVGKSEVEIYEVKSSTSVHDIYYHDAAFQYYVLTKCGWSVTRCSIVHINNEYVRKGELDLQQLFTIADVTEEVMAMQNGVADNIATIQAYMEQEDEPLDDIGPHCFDPYKCGFFSYCTAHLEQPNVFSLAGLNTSKKLECYDKGITSYEALNTCDLLNAKQYMQIEHELYHYPPAVDEKSIRNYIGKLSYPLYFLDFESFQPAVPLFDDSKPYEQIVFQYSLHYIEEDGGELQHKEFLAYPGEDPRRALAEQLCRDIPLDVCTTAYNMGFEKGRIKSLAALYPDLQEHLINIHDNIQDLMTPFQKKWYYCRDMQGSYSIKYVLPALFPNDPELDYHNLEGVQNGTAASAAFHHMMQLAMGDNAHPTEVAEELATLRQQLLRYCGLDTYAMVKIWEKLKKV